MQITWEKGTCRKVMLIDHISSLKPSLLIWVDCIVRISRWIDEEEEKLKCSQKQDLQYLILDMSGEYSFIQEHAFWTYGIKID